MQPKERTDVESSYCSLERLTWVILLPDSASIYFGVPGSCPRDLDTIRLSHMNY